MITPGSGGFGPASERSHEAIARDLVDGYVTPEAARRDYDIADPAALTRDERKA